MITRTDSRNQSTETSDDREWMLNYARKHYVAIPELVIREAEAARNLSGGTKSARATLGGDLAMGVKPMKGAASARINSKEPEVPYPTDSESSVSPTQNTSPVPKADGARVAQP